MSICGVIAEYDPFHKGHERHLRLAREKTGADHIVCVMSGSFTQRGLPALLPASVRAEMALRCGTDIVLQLPYAFSVREAEFFALGGVHILNALPSEIAEWPGVAEGLEQRILKAAETAVSREALIANLKTRRYTYGRISRALCHGMMGVKRAELPALPDHARVLGFRESARSLLRKMQKSGFPLLTRPAREPAAALDIRADELWAIGAGVPRGETYRIKPIII